MNVSNQPTDPEFIDLNEQKILHENAEKELKLSAIVKSGKFLTLYVLAVSHLFYGYYYTNVYKIYGTEYINDDKFLTFVGASAALFNGFFKFIWSFALDYFSFKRIYGGLIILEICLIGLVNYAVYNRYAFMVVTWLTFMCDGSLTSMLPAVTVDQFGIKRGPQVYSIMYSCFGCSAVLGLILV